MPVAKALLTAATALTCAIAAVPAAAEGNCPALRWVTLGTAGGPVPTPDRSEPANLLIAGNRNILVDTGDGTVNQMAKIGMQIGAVDTVLISHLHLDHTGGLAAVIGLRWMNQFPGRLTVYGPPGTRQIVDGIVASMAPPSRIGFGLGVLPPSPAEAVVVVEIDDGTRLSLGDLSVRAVANSHFDHGGGSAADHGVSLSYRFELGWRSITYTGDTGPSAAVETLVAGSDMLVSEVIDLDRLIADIRLRRTDAPPGMFDQMTQHLSTHHLTAPDLGRLAAKAKVGRLVLTHFAAPGPLAAAEPGLRAGVRLSYAGPVDLARDLSSFDIGCEQ